MRVEPCPHYEPFEEAGGVTFAVRIDGRIVTCHIPAEEAAVLPGAGTGLDRFGANRQTIEATVGRLAARVNGRLPLRMTVRKPRD